LFVIELLLLNIYNSVCVGVIPRIGHVHSLTKVIATTLAKSFDVLDAAADVHRSVISADELEEESRCCYERYRILVQNECAGG